jgi:ribosome-binding ATPase YchF (GTP1/OBG family)
MSLLIGLVGKPNAGKSTMLKALTLADVKIANYPFTTINPNVAVGYVVADCPCRGLGIKCNPQNSQCREGKRMIPVSLMDVAGLVPGAHEGRGLGNKFLDDLRQASCLIHVVDMSGMTNEEGTPTKGHDPSLDIKFLENEIDEWFFSILKRGLEKYERKSKYEKADIIKILSEQVTGLGMTSEKVVSVLDRHPIADFSEDSIRNFATALRMETKPIMIAANKMDSQESERNLEKLSLNYPDSLINPCCAEAEVALRLAEKNGKIEYFQGDCDFHIIEAAEKQRAALDMIKKIMEKYGSTGVQQCLNNAVFGLMEYIVVYPVENETRLSNKKGHVLPDVHLIPKGSTALELAAAVHTDLAKNFIGAVDARTKKRVSAGHELKNNDIIKIISGRG